MALPPRGGSVGSPPAGLGGPQQHGMLSGPGLPSGLAYGEAPRLHMDMAEEQLIEYIMLHHE